MRFVIVWASSEKLADTTLYHSFGSALRELQTWSVPPKCFKVVPLLEVANELPQ